MSFTWQGVAQCDIDECAERVAAQFTLTSEREIDVDISERGWTVRRIARGDDSCRDVNEVDLDGAAYEVRCPTHVRGF